MSFTAFIKNKETAAAREAAEQAAAAQSRLEKRIADTVPIALEKMVDCFGEDAAKLQLTDGTEHAPNVRVDRERIIDYKVRTPAGKDTRVVCVCAEMQYRGIDDSTRSSYSVSFAKLKRGHLREITELEAAKMIDAAM